MSRILTDAPFTGETLVTAKYLRRGSGQQTGVVVVVGIVGPILGMHGFGVG